MITVTGCRILVKPFDITEHDEIYRRAKQVNIQLLDISERKQQIEVDKGTVLQIGPKAHSDYIGDLQVGDTIGFAKFGGKFIKEKDNTFLVINDEDVICIIKD